jgi:CHASE2 domain-containing sensor protein
MEHLTGTTLEHAIRSAAMAPADALPILSAVASAIDFAHKHGVLHRDIKPENVFLLRDGDTPPSVKVLDFGVAHIGTPLGSDETDGMRRENRPMVRAAAAQQSATSRDDELTRVWTGDDDYAAGSASSFLTTPGEIIGTLPYMAPELLAGDSASRASDVYAFGVVAYQMLVGKRPKNIKHLDDVYEAPAPAHTLNQSLTPAMSRVLAWPLNQYASERPSSTRQFVEALSDAHHQSMVQTWRRTELPRRRRLSVAVALVLCAAAWQLDGRDWTRALEDQLIDARFRLSPRRAADPRIVVVLVDDATLADGRELLGERADEFAERFEQMFAAGAKGIAIDLLLPQRWSTSERFSRLVLTHSDHLALSAVSGADGQVTGPECVAGVTTAALGPERASALFGFVNLDTDADGVTRRAHLRFADTLGARRDSFAVRSIRAAFEDSALTAASMRRPGERVQDTFLIDGRVDTARLRTISWTRLSAELKSSSSVFRDRLVLVGASFVGSGDLHRLIGNSLIPGVMVQAVITDTILNGLPIRALDVLGWLPVLLLLSWLVATQAVGPDRLAALWWTCAATAIWVTATVVLFVGAGWTVPMFVPVAMIVAAGLVGAMLRPFLQPYPKREAIST